MAPIGKVAYGLLFQDPGHDSLLARPLGSGQSCTTQLVHSYSTGALVVRKTLRHPARRGGILDRAVHEFDRDVSMARLLLAGAAAAGHTLRIPRLLSAASTPRGGRVSHWDLCNGGTLWAFLDRCRQSSAVLPQGLALHLLQQILETLDFMYTGMESTGSGGPVYHRDLHPGNIMLHFPSGRPLPEAWLIDFGRAVQVTTTSGTGPEETDDPLPWWDIGAVLSLIRKDLAPLSRPTSRRDPARMARYLNDHRASDKRHAPLRAAYHMLDGLHHAFADNVVATIKEQERWRAEAQADWDKGPLKVKVPEPPIAMPPSPPSLKPVLALLRRAVRRHIPRHPAPADGAFGDRFRERVLIPAREGAEALSGARPRLCRGRAEELLRRLEEEDEGNLIRGPWVVAEVDLADPGLGVVDVLTGWDDDGEPSSPSTVDYGDEDAEGGEGVEGVENAEGDQSAEEDEECLTMTW
ncbi:hypothetical protein N658DRAFT_510230 [Parathielavia hyrcaniae]|uniref:Protein kinase domain-containing protein n=1 Tax=Parathielavia hyrcaniae TaxID=113614 RepID=A0AAN6SY30_9PEZI|nr:hypothetical protein N658DRAFT_510230 [Parathielavia hyrcaniae]